MEGILVKISDFFIQNGPSIIGAIVVLIVGRIIAGIGRKLIKRILTKGDTDQAIVFFVGNITFAVILIFTVLTALAKFGIETASFVAVLGAAGFAVGFALQGSLSNFASGVLILVLRPYKIGDVIDAAGVVGTVKEIELFNTVLATPDNVKVMVPNSKIYGDIIKNLSSNDTRRVDLVVGIGYNSSIGKAYEVLNGLIKEDKRILVDPEPTVAVAELADSSVNFVVRPWVKKEDYWAVKFDLTQKVKESFDKHNLEIPFPQRVVHNVPVSTSN